MFENMRLVIFFDMLLNPSFKMTRSFANIARTTASTNMSYHSIKMSASIKMSNIRNWVFI